MKYLNRIFLVLFSLVIIISCDSGGGWSTDVVLDPSYYTDLHGWNATGGLAFTDLGRGINMGNFLESPLSDGGEGAWVGGRLIQENDFTIIKNAGFKTVRIPIRWDDYAGTSSPYTINSTFMTRVKTVVGWALAQDVQETRENRCQCIHWFGKDLVNA